MNILYASKTKVINMTTEINKRKKIIFYCYFIEYALYRWMS